MEESVYSGLNLKPQNDVIMALVSILILDFLVWINMK